MAGLSFVDGSSLFWVAILCTWSVHSYVIAVSSRKEARAMVRKEERRVRVARMLRSRDLRQLPSCIVIHVDPVTLEPLAPPEP